MKITERIQHAWNAFTSDNLGLYLDNGSMGSRPVHKKTNSFNATSFANSIYNRIAVDASMTKFRHVKINPENEDATIISSGINYCLNTEANVDQTHIQLIHDIVYSMFDEGVIAVVPVDTNISPKITGGYDILTMRVGKIREWFPKHVRVNLYNEQTGEFKDVTLPKDSIAIIENPLYAIVNAPNSTLKRLVMKIGQQDSIDDVAASGNLDIVIQVPYAIKTDLQRKMTDKRIKDLENQLKSNSHGIAYTDATEKLTQLSRPVVSQIPESVESLKREFYNQLGLTENVFNGTASEEEMRTYYSRTIDIILDNIIAEFNRKFLTKTARTQGHTIEYYRDMFKMVPVETIATLGDTVRRNSIMTSNEMRKVIGIKPSNDPRADELYNPNMGDEKQTKSIVQEKQDLKKIQGKKEKKEK